jgi:hypothetical protein
MRSGHSRDSGAGTPHTGAAGARTGRAWAISTPCCASSSTRSTMVFSTPSSPAHTLPVRTPFRTRDRSQPGNWNRRQGRRDAQHLTAPTDASEEPFDSPVCCLPECEAGWRCKRILTLQLRRTSRSWCCVTRSWCCADSFHVWLTWVDHTFLSALARLLVGAENRVTRSDQGLRVRPGATTTGHHRCA